jgi:uncharacterized membrane protein HdeD (DUF308 family)
MDSKVVSRIWWSLAMRGVLAILLGMGAFVFTGQTMLALVWMFGAFAVLSGVASLALAVRAGEAHQRWALLAVSGVLSITAGVAAFVWPGLTALAVVLLVAFWAIATGILEISFVLAAPISVPHPWLLACSGLLSVIFGVVLAAWPRAGAVSLTWLVGLYALAYGATQLYYAYRVQGLRHDVESLREAGQRVAGKRAQA